MAGSLFGGALNLFNNAIGNPPDGSLILSADNPGIPGEGP